MDREELERRLAVVAGYRASGQQARVWADANGVPLASLAIWCTHAKRWQARLDGVPAVAAPPKPSGFIAARVPPVTTSTVRVELSAGVTRVELHWPLAHTHELASTGCWPWWCMGLRWAHRPTTPTCSPTAVPTGSKCSCTTAPACGCAHDVCKPVGSPGRATGMLHRSPSRASSSTGSSLACHGSA